MTSTIRPSPAPRSTAASALASSSPEWWRGCVIYQIYPRSFYDHDGDGIGDLRGITSKLDYVASLGVDAVWLSPFFRSPMKDFGYDVSDYRDVEPMFGTLADFDALVARAHELGLRVLIDQVVSHTSDEHPWFRESRASASPDNPKADWYVWADARPDGTPPNNWLSYFGGSAWEWDTRRKQYYLHNFLASQPDLNFHNPEVTAQVLSDMEFWLARGVSGFRLDTVNLYFHDRELRSNPPWDRRIARRDGVPDTNPYSYQQHIYDKSRPENIEFIKRLRALCDRHPGITTVGELSSEDAARAMAEYTSGGDKLHMAYAFELLTNEFSAGHIRRVIESMEEAIGDGWICWSLSNHDVIRVTTRWGGAEAPPALAKCLLALLLSLRGSVCLYQGEELGLSEADVPYEHVQDPYGLRFWPAFKGRDGCRTPMPWTSEQDAGFSAGVPWLPIPAEHRSRAVMVQEEAPDSVLQACRRLLAFRRGQPALCQGSIELVEVAEPVLALVRSHAGARILAVFNLAAAPSTVKLSGDLARAEILSDHGFAPAPCSGGAIELPAYGVGFYRLPDHR